MENPYDENNEVQEPKQDRTELQSTIRWFRYAKRIPSILLLISIVSGLITAIFYFSQGGYIPLGILSIVVACLAGILSFVISKVIVSYFLLRIHYIQKQTNESKENDVIH